MEDAPKLLKPKIPKSECPDVWVVFHDTSGPTSWSNIEDTVVPLERNLYGHPLAGVVGRQVEEVLLGLGWEKSTELETSICSLKNKDCSYRYTHVDDTKKGWKETTSQSHAEEIDETR